MSEEISQSQLKENTKKINNTREQLVRLDERFNSLVAEVQGGRADLKEMMNASAEHRKSLDERLTKVETKAITHDISTKTLIKILGILLTGGASVGATIDLILKLLS